MNLDAMSALFENEEDDEFLNFKAVSHKLSGRPDVHAFMLLDLITGDTGDMVSAAEHDEIYLGVDLEKLCRIISEAQILDLRRCGVRYDSELDSLAMFV